MNKKRLQQFSLLVLIYNISVTLWGAFVRASGSGAGCGNSWPRCNGVVIPRPETVETIIEFTHRITSGLAIILVIALFIFTWKNIHKGHPARVTALLSLVFIITESLLGAGLVLFDLVAYNVSVARAWWMAFHLLNTFLLLAWLALTTIWIGQDEVRRLPAPKTSYLMFGLALLSMLLLVMNGGITALGHTILSQTDKLTGEISAVQEFLSGVIDLHPIIAIAITAFLFILTINYLNKLKPENKWIGFGVLLGLFVQVIVGMINLSLAAPIWLQILHLFLSIVGWLFLVYFTERYMTSRKQKKSRRRK